MRCSCLQLRDVDVCTDTVYAIPHVAFEMLQDYRTLHPLQFIAMRLPYIGIYVACALTHAVSCN